MSNWVTPNSWYQEPEREPLPFEETDQYREEVKSEVIAASSGVIELIKNLEACNKVSFSDVAIKDIVAEEYSVEILAEYLYDLVTEKKELLNPVAELATYFRPNNKPLKQ